MGSLEPGYRYVFRLRDGETLTCDPRLAKRVIDRRHERSEPEPLWEIALPSGLIRRVWMDEIAEWTSEEVA